MVDAIRIKTMKQKLGNAVDLIDDDKYLPMFRNRQLNHEELFNHSVELAKKKTSPSRYFATIWSPKNLEKTLNMLKKLVNIAKVALANLFWKNKAEKSDKKATQVMGDHEYELDRLATLKEAWGFRPVRR